MEVLINPMNVLNILLVWFQAMNIPPTLINIEEQQFAEDIAILLKDAMQNLLIPEPVREKGLAFQEDFKDWESIPVDDSVDFLDLSENFEEYEYSEYENDYNVSFGGKTKECSKDNQQVTFEYKKNAVRYWTGCDRKKLRTFQQVVHRYPRVISLKQLYRWKEHVAKGGTYVEKIKNICDFTLNQCKSAIESGYVFHDIDIRRWGLRAKIELGYNDLNFKASSTWVSNFKIAHRIVSRKINKFLTKKTLEQADKLQLSAQEFVQNITQQIPIYGLENIYNTDESGFQLEMHSGRTLTTAGVKKVQCVVNSLSATTHSYTVQPVISANGILFPKVFIVLKEQSGGFGPYVKANLFKPTNVYITASTSGKSTSSSVIGI